MKRSATARWEGSLKQGTGEISTESGVLKNAPYSFTTRFENEPGTNPEELIAAAHAGCFTMALAAALQEAGFVLDSLETEASITMEINPQTSWTMASVILRTEARVPVIEPAKFQEVAASAKAKCPISRLLKADIILDARLMALEAKLG